MPNKKNIAKASLHAGGNINIGDVINYYINIDTPLPNGVNPLSNYLFTGDKATKYKQYLSGNILDYVSRDDFKRKNNLQKFLDESEIIKNFLMKDDMEGCIISGEGGVGKTRLLIQIGLYAFSQRWNVFFLTTRFSDFRTLANFLEFTNNIEGKHNGKHLLIIDYTEECNWYTPDFIEEIFTYNPNLKVKVIANCRNSFISSSNYPHSYYQAKLFESENEKEYQKHVINNILSPIKINIGNIDRFDFHSLKPSYAVFLRYLYESGKQLDILESGDFKEWLKKRFLATINVGNDFSEAEKAVIYLMSLPTNNNEALFNYNENKVLTNQIERLVNNGWIDEVELETGEIVYQSIHDTITDELLILLLEAKNRRQNIFFKDSIEFASAFKKTTNWIRSFERINGASSFDTIAFVKFIENCIDECEYLVNNKYELATTSLFEEEERIKLINNHLVFFSEYTKDILFGFPLSFALNVFSKKKSIPKGLKPLADNWLLVNKDLSSDRNIAHRIISTYIKLFGYLPEIKSHFEIYLTLPQSPWSSYVIKSFIDKTENIDFITKYTIQYLQNFAVTRQASFVLSAWLDKDGDKEIIQDFLIQYLVQNAKEKEARFILGRWLDKDGDKGIIQDFLIQYLEQNATEKENSFVLSAWLDKDGVKGIIQDFLIQYLEQNAIEKEASFVLGAWLDKNGDKEIIQDFLIQYLEQNAIEKETSFDFKAWLDKDGDKGIIQDFLIQYLKQNAKEKETGFVLGAWLDKDGDKEIIQDFLIQYLEQNAKDEEARYVFDAFLKRSIEIKNIEIFLKKFLEKYSEKDFASYVIHPYLKNYKDLDFIKPYFGKWLDNFVNKINTRFDLQFWLQKSSDYDFIKPYILKWLNQYYNNYFASYILQTYLDKTGDFITIKDFIYEWLPLHGENKGANYLLQSVIAYEQQSDIILPYCNKWLAKFGNVHSAHFLIVKWLEFHSYELLKAEIDSWLLLYSYSSAGERIVQMIKKQ